MIENGKASPPPKVHQDDNEIVCLHDEIEPDEGDPTIGTCAECGEVMVIEITADGAPSQDGGEGAR